MTHAAPPEWWNATPVDDIVAAGFDDAGDAWQVGGASPKRLLRSRLDGRPYLFKAWDRHGRPRRHRAEADRLAAALAADLFDPGEFVPVGLFTLPRDPVAGGGPVVGSVQPLLDATEDAGLFRGGSLPSPADVARVQREQVLDWLVSNHDAHPGQWLRRHGRLLPVDKTQAGKHLGEDRLDPDYHPNGAFGERPPVYHDLFHAARAGRLDVSSDAIGTTLDRADALSDDDFSGHFAGLLDAVGPPRAAAHRRTLLERKRRLRDDFSTYYGRMFGRPVRL